MVLNESGKTPSANDLLNSSVMKGATTSAFCLISRDGTGSRPQVFPSDFLSSSMTSSVVADENVSVVIDVVLPMYGGLALEVSSQMSSPS